MVLVPWKLHLIPPDCCYGYKHQTLSQQPSFKDININRHQPQLFIHTNIIERNKFRGGKTPIKTPTHVFTNWWLSTRLQYLQCFSTGDTAVLYYAIKILRLINIYFLGYKKKLEIVDQWSTRIPPPHRRGWQWAMGGLQLNIVENHKAAILKAT